MMRRNRDIEGAVSGMSGGARGKSNGGPASQATTQKGKSVSGGGSSVGDEIFAGRCSTTVNRLPTVLLPGVFRSEKPDGSEEDAWEHICQDEDLFGQGWYDKETLLTVRGAQRIKGVDSSAVLGALMMRAFLASLLS